MNDTQSNLLSPPWWKRRFTLLTLVLTVIGVNYVLMGLLITFDSDPLPLPHVSTTALFGQATITIGLFAFFLAMKPAAYEKLIWVMMFNEVTVSAAVYHQVAIGRASPEEGPVVYIHLAYLAALAFLMLFKGLFPEAKAANNSPVLSQTPG